MKRIVTISMILFLSLSLFLAGCGRRPTVGQEDDGRLSVVSTIFPGYDFTREVAGDSVKLTMLLAPGAESHSFDPTPQDIITIQDCDVFICVGGDSDNWVDGILSSMDTSNMTIIKMLDLVEAVEEEVKEGMEDAHGHSHGDEAFEVEDVEDRALTDWAGQWQSVYPYLLDGTLTPVLEAKAQASEGMTIEDYHAYYLTGYKSEVDRIAIDAAGITFYGEEGSAHGAYRYTGFEVLTYESGSKGVRYLFEAEGEETEAPRYVQFSDHYIGPTDSEHFHLYFGNDSQEALLEEGTNWPTYYPAFLDGAAIVEEMLGHDHAHHDDEDHEDEAAELDEHVWTSPRNAMVISAAIANTLSKLDAENAGQYQSNVEVYLEKLEALDRTFLEIAQEGVGDTMIFGDRFPFRYFADAYGLDYYAAFPGCSTETEASAKTVAFLIEKVREEEIPVVFFIEFSNEKMADVICESTGATKLLFHSCHNLTKRDFDAGVTYLELMTQNAENLREALG